ncbi:MAG: Flagellar motor switch protein FliN [Alphaproteobacteria bacterium MarineAlpha2_Bin1]|nr:MAG: Flagellar motor switch protein FliN [Alphaproteobacteria bacterium MarineAlpha2_Bin1]|tara:strand:- start:568 stop:987 length:420 start_codon:yes stop_codon:yes gene_type:complete
MTDTENNNENTNSTETDKKDNDSAIEKNLNLSELEGSVAKESMETKQAEPSDDDEVRMASELEPVYEIPVQVSAVLGKTRMQVSDLLKLGQGAVVELDRRVGEAIDIYVNNRLVARGEVVVVENKLGVTMTEIIKTEKS